MLWQGVAGRDLEDLSLGDSTDLIIARMSRPEALSLLGPVRMRYALAWLRLLSRVSLCVPKWLLGLGFCILERPRLPIKRYSSVISCGVRSLEIGVAIFS